MIKIILLTLFILSVLVMAGYCIFLFRHLAFYKLSRNNSLLSNQFPNEPVSVIICAHDEEKNLAGLLPLLYKQQYPDYEIIVVNDASNDHTLDFLLAEKQDHPQLKIVNIWNRVEHVHGKKYGLTLGIRAAQNDIILLTDADCRPASSYWIREMAKPFQTPDIALVLGYSPYIKKKGILNALIRFETMFTAMFYLSAALAGTPYMGVGRNLAYRKSFFMAKKGFYPFQGLLGGDDDLFVNQHARDDNTSIKITGEALVYSLPKNNWKDFFKQKKRHLGIGKFYKQKDKYLTGTFSIFQGLFWFIFCYLIFIGKPYLAIGGFLIRMVLFYIFFLKTSKKIKGDSFKFLFPLMELIFVVYYFGTGIMALFTRRQSWK